MKLSETTKQKIAQLIAKDFVCHIFNERLKKYYSDFKEVKSIETKPFKKHLGLTSAVFVVEYQIKYLSSQGALKDLDIFVSAHSDGSRKGAYEKTKTLYEHGFGQGKYRVTKPLFFLDEQQAFFYVASPGRSFFSFFLENTQADLTKAMELMAGWLKQLHNFDTKIANFKWPIFNILDMVPTPQKFVKDFYNSSDKLGQHMDNLVKDLQALDLEYRQKNKETLVYGDFHPENVIMRGLDVQDIEMIDFTDIALGDPMMDIGAFIQQFDFMGHNFISRPEIDRHKQSFVEIYFGQKFEEIDIEYINRINLYQSWTAMRTAVFLFYMKNVFNPIDDLLLDSIKYLDMAKNSQRAINIS